MRWIVLLVVAIAVIPSASTAQAPEAPRALHLLERRTPALRVPRYRTTGTYPQVSGAAMDLTRVNHALHRALLAEERRYARDARREEREVPTLPSYKGVFHTAPRTDLTSASTRVVSTMIALRELYPGGNDGDGWLAVTVRVPSGSRVSITDLFVSPSKGLQALASRVRKQILATNQCVQETVANSPDSWTRRSYLRGFHPTSRNYRYFALTPRGLAVGFPLGDVSSPPCGRIETVVAYAALAPYLSSLGKELVGGALTPLRPGGETHTPQP
jgi:hypothetical protein